MTAAEVKVVADLLMRAWRAGRHFGAAEAAEDRFKVRCIEASQREGIRGVRITETGLRGKAARALVVWFEQRNENAIRWLDRVQGRDGMTEAERGGLRRLNARLTGAVFGKEGGDG